MKKKNQKLLSVVSAALLAGQVFAPAFGISAADSNNEVKKFTPKLDGVKDDAYNGSYSVRFSDLARDKRLDMSTFQMQEQLFYRVYETQDGKWSGLLTMFDNSGREITWDIFQKEFDGLYSEFVIANTYDSGKVDEKTEDPIMANDIRFRWTEEGLKSQYFTDAVVSFLWDDSGIYIYADVEDKNILHYGMDGSNIDKYFSGWSGRPWMVDSISATFRIDNLPHTEYKIVNTKKDKSGEIIPDEKKCTSYTEVGVTALGNGMAYYSQPSYAVFNKETLSVDYNKYTLLNDFCINWWEYCYYQSEDTPAGIATSFRDKVCHGGDNINDDKTVGKTCHDSESDFIFRHIMTPEAFAKRDAGRAENLKYLKSVTRDNGYSLEMLVPFTEEAMKRIDENNSEVGVRLQVVNAMFVPSKNGGASWSNDGNATSWTLSAMDNGDYDPAVGKPIREADNITLTLYDDSFDVSDIIGDFNGDKVINSKDLTRLMKYLAGEDVQINGGDVTGDGKVNSKDLTRLMKYLAGEDVVLEEQGREDIPQET